MSATNFWHCAAAPLVLLLILWSLALPVSGFVPPSSVVSPRMASFQFATRYGPPMEDMDRLYQNQHEENDDDSHYNHQQAEFTRLLDKVLETVQPEHLPSLLTKHTQLILTLRDGRLAVRLVEDAMERAREQGGDPEVQRVAQAVDWILSFTEDFVHQSDHLDQQHKKLLGMILRAMTATDQRHQSREDRLDQLFATEKEHFSKGFLRHLDAQCHRIANAPQITREGIRMQEIITIIKTRIIEELGNDLGEGAQVLGQLVAYDDPDERLAILDVGLMVRGIDFALQLKDLTEEALQGFQRVPDDGVDPALVNMLEEIDEILHL